MKKFIFSIILYVIAVAFLLTAIATAIVPMAEYTIFNSFDSGTSTFGFKAYTVRSDSMKPVFEAGDVVIVKEMSDYSSLKEGDIIAFISQNPDEGYNQIVTHEISQVTRTEDGTLAYITRGINTDTEDPVLVTDPYIQGKYVCKIPGLGRFASFMWTPQGFIISLILPSLLLLLAVVCIVPATILMIIYIKKKASEKVSKPEDDQIEQPKKEIESE